MTTSQQAPFDLIITNADLVLSSPTDPYRFKISKMDIAVLNGKIAQIGTLAHLPTKKVWNASGLCVLPGLIDTQVHFREPGLEHKETIEDGSRSAVAGGITGFFEMPNTSPPTTSTEALKNKLEIAKNRSYCDYAFYAGASDTNYEHLSELEKIPGCAGVKVFMGSSTGSLLVKSDKLLEKVLQNTHRRIAVHCEDEDRLIERRSIAENSGGDVQAHAKWRDATSALLATQRLLKLSQPLKHPVHVLHVSTAEEMEFFKKNKTEHVSIEVTPQHLTLYSPDCYDRLGTLAQMNPPIRSEDHQRALWKALQTGLVDIIGSDHAPHTLDEKSNDYPNTPSGMPGVQTTVPIMLNHIHSGHLHLHDLVRLMAVNPSIIFGLDKKGFIAPGHEATFTVIDLKKEQTIEDSWIESKVKWTPFAGKRVIGWPVATILRGEFAMREGTIRRITPQPFQFLK